MRVAGERAEKVRVERNIGGLSATYCLDNDTICFMDGGCALKFDVILRVPAVARRQIDFAHFLTE